MTEPFSHEADGVFQGGGVKGIALAGALEEFADRAGHPDNYVDKWVQLAGTSAGAIIAAYLACGNSVADTAKLVAETDFTQFEDWGPGGETAGRRDQPRPAPRPRPRQGLPRVVSQSRPKRRPSATSKAPAARSS